MQVCYPSKFRFPLYHHWNIISLVIITYVVIVVVGSGGGGRGSGSGGGGGGIPECSLGKSKTSDASACFSIFSVKRGEGRGERDYRDKNF